MGRVETQVDPDVGPLQLFAHDLQVLRRRAGEPTYRAMGRRVGMSPSVLSEAAKGRRMPTLQATLAFVRACDAGAESAWHKRWEQTRAQLNRKPPPVVPDRQPRPAAAPAVSGGGSPWRHRRWVAAALVAVAPFVGVGSQSTVEQFTVHAVADGEDPYIAGCGHDQQPLEHQPIYWADGKSYGWVVLFYSAACSGAWGYVLGPNSPNWRIHVNAHRLDDNVEAPSSFRGAARPNSWGNALSARNGCVRAEAWVDNGPRAVTSCWQSRGPVTSARP